MVSSLVTSGHALASSPATLRALEGTTDPGTLLPGAARVHLHDSLHGPGQEILLGQATRIGRALDNQIQLDCHLSSRHHCRIVRSAGHYWIVDLDSRDGTWLNGERVPRALLRDGDLIQIGNKVLTFVAPSSQPSPPEWIREAATPSWLAESAPPVWPGTGHFSPWLEPTTPTIRVALTSPAPVVIRPRGRERVCPLCHDEVGSLKCGHCPDCLTVYHRTCYAELGGCATLGCSAKGRLPEGGGAARPLAWDWVLLLVKWVVLWATALGFGSAIRPLFPVAATLVLFVPAAALCWKWVSYRRSRTPAREAFAI